MSNGTSDDHEPQAEDPQPQTWPYDYSISVSLPRAVIFHHIEDGEVERLTKGGRPVTSGVAFTSAGIFFGAIVPASAELVDLLSGAIWSWPGFISMLVTVGAFVGMLVAGPIALSHRNEKKRILENLRSRPRVALPFGQADLPTSRAFSHPSESGGIPFWAVL